MKASKAIPEPSLDDIAFLLREIQKMDFYQDRVAIAAIAKKYRLPHVANGDPPPSR